MSKIYTLFQVYSSKYTFCKTWGMEWIEHPKRTNQVDARERSAIYPLINKKNSTVVVLPYHKTTSNRKMGSDSSIPIDHF